MIHLWKSCLFPLCKVLFDTQFSLPVSILVAFCILYPRIIYDVCMFFKGQFIGVVGKVGSGKSSLLNAILAEMQRIGGQIWIRNLEEGFALVSQESWIQQCTIRDNILFGKPCDYRRYEKVLEASTLADDLKVKILNFLFFVFFVFFFTIDASVYLICRQCPLLNMAMLL